MLLTVTNAETLCKELDPVMFVRHAERLADVRKNDNYRIRCNIIEVCLMGMIRVFDQGNARDSGSSVPFYCARKREVLTR